MVERSPGLSPEEPIAEGSAVEGPAVEEPTADMKGIVVEEPTAGVGGTVVEEPTADMKGIVVEEPTAGVGETVVEEPTADMKGTVVDSQESVVGGEDSEEHTMGWKGSTVKDPVPDVPTIEGAVVEASEVEGRTSEYALLGAPSSVPEGTSFSATGSVLNWPTASSDILEREGITVP